MVRIDERRETREEKSEQGRHKTKERKEKSCVSYPEGNQQDSPREGPARESRKWPDICDFI